MPEQKRSYALDDYAGWPATPSTARLIAAHDIVSNWPGNLNETVHFTDDPALDMDCHHYVLTHASLGYIESLRRELRRPPKDGMEALHRLLDMLVNADTDHTMGAAVLDYTNTSGLVLSIRSIFALQRHPEWQGVSPYLPQLSGLRLLIWESQHRANSPGAIIAAPGDMYLYPKHEATMPTGEATDFTEVARWHGATHFHWIPADDDHDNPWQIPELAPTEPALRSPA